MTVGVTSNLSKQLRFWQVATGFEQGEVPGAIMRGYAPQSKRSTEASRAADQDGYQYTSAFSIVLSD